MAAETTEKYDFIIVGAGPSGATLASHLASSLPSLRILLLEAGESGVDNALLYDRYTALMTPGLNYGYQTVPQESLNGSIVNYSRGKGLGGTSLINFGLWTRGPRDDYDRWARLVGNADFGWENIRKVFNDIETFSDPGYTDERSNYVSFEKDAHGQSGPVNVELPRRWESHILALMKGVEEHGFQMNKDLSSGNPIGVGLCPATSREGVRVTAKTAYLSSVPDNLRVKTGVQVARVLFEEGKAVGVKSVNGTKFFAQKEVILSAGALDSPKLLLLSGVGPAADLASLNIPVVQDLQYVGKNLQDHCHFPVTAVVRDSTREPNKLRPGSDVLAAARAEFAQGGTGPLAYVNGSYILGFLKDESLYSSEEFQSLDQQTREHLKKPTIPSWEFCTGLPLLGPPPPGPPRQFLSSVAVLMNPQSRGIVKLQSTDPRQPALFDPRLMTDPYDQKVLVAAAELVLSFLKTPSIAATIEAPAKMPASDSKEDILDFIKANLKSTWHMSGTCKMGLGEHDEAVVDPQFRVRGIEGLRVVDLSVSPFLVNAHPVACAYAVGKIAAETIRMQHGPKEV